MRAPKADWRAPTFQRRFFRLLTRRLDVVVVQVHRVALGPFLRADGVGSGEVFRRIRAMRAAWRRAGDVWGGKVPFRVLRMIFLGLIVGTLVSMMEAYVFVGSGGREDAGRHGPALALRLSMRDDERHRSIGRNPRPLYFGDGAYLGWRWNLGGPTGPPQAGVHGVFFWTLAIDRWAQEERLWIEGEMLDTSTPWATQMVQDFGRLQGHDGTQGWLEEVMQKPVLLFAEGSQAGQDSVKFDVGVLRAAEFSANFAPCGAEADAGQIAETSSEAEGEFATSAKICTARTTPCPPMFGFITMNNICCPSCVLQTSVHGA